MKNMWNMKYYLINIWNWRNSYSLNNYWTIEETTQYHLINDWGLSVVHNQGIVLQRISLRYVNVVYCIRESQIKKDFIKYIKLTSLHEGNILWHLKLR